MSTRIMHLYAAKCQRNISLKFIQMSTDGTKSETPFPLFCKLLFLCYISCSCLLQRVIIVNWNSDIGSLSGIHILHPSVFHLLHFTLAVKIPLQRNQLLLRRPPRSYRSLSIDTIDSHLIDTINSCSQESPSIESIVINRSTVSWSTQATIAKKTPLIYRSLSIDTIDSQLINTINSCLEDPRYDRWGSWEQELIVSINWLSIVSIDNDRPSVDRHNQLLLSISLVDRIDRSAVSWSTQSTLALKMPHHVRTLFENQKLIFSAFIVWRSPRAELKFHEARASCRILTTTTSFITRWTLKNIKF